jgi:hypothetical protein
VAAALHVQGVGEIPLGHGAVRQLRRLIARGGEPRTLTITRSRSGAWRACVGFRGVALRPLPETTDIGGVDRGIWVTAALPDGTLLTCPAFLKAARALIAELQRQREQYEKVLTGVEEDQQGRGQELRQGPPAFGELGPAHSHRDRRPLRSDRPRGPRSRQHDQISQGNQRGPREGSGPEEGTESKPARRCTGSTGLLDLREGGRGRTQSMESRPKRFLERVHWLRAHRGRQPVPGQIHLPQVPARRARPRQCGPGPHRTRAGSRDVLACGRLPCGQEAGAEEPAAPGGRTIKQYGAGSAPYAEVTRMRDLNCGRPLADYVHPRRLSPTMRG